MSSYSQPAVQHEHCKTADGNKDAQDTDSITETLSSVDKQTDHDALRQASLTAQSTHTSGHMSLAERVTTIPTNITTDPNFEVDFDGPDDPQNPKNWKRGYASMALVFLSWNTLIVVLYSTAYTSGATQIAVRFGTTELIVDLGLTMYLLGLAGGSMLMSPLSEVYGRKPVCVGCLFMFTVLVIPCALAKNVVTLIVVRFIAACFGSVMISTAPGMLSDMYEPEQRGMAMSVWSIGPLNGPVLGPIIGGFVTQYLGWRWMDWIVLILSGVAFGFSVILKETYTPTILRKKAARIRKETGDSRWWSRYDQKENIITVLKLNLSRPFVMLVTEPICIFWDVYVAIVYGILYLCFVAYPIVFSDIRDWSLGISGLAFIGIGVGSMITITCEPLVRRLINRHPKDPETGRVYPEAMVAFMCICAILIPVGELWFAWTCAPKSIHWIVPVLAGIPFGAGNTGVFIYASTYLTNSYGIYAASALAGSSVVRCILGGVLPLAGSSMYNTLGPNWAGTLLGLLEVLIAPIPFVFYKYGHIIRQKSSMITRMQDDKKNEDAKRAHRLARIQPDVNDVEKN